MMIARHPNQRPGELMILQARGAFATWPASTISRSRRPSTRRKDCAGMFTSSTSPISAAAAPGEPAAAPTVPTAPWRATAVRREVEGFGRTRRAGAGRPPGACPARRRRPASSIAAPTGPAPPPAAARSRPSAERVVLAQKGRRAHVQLVAVVGLVDRRADRARAAAGRREARGLRPNAPCWRRKAAGRMSSSSRPAGLVDRRADRARATAVRREVEAFV